MNKQIKNQASFNNELTDTFAKMSISHKYIIVGSSNLLDTIHTTDFDLNDAFDVDTKDPEKVYDKIYSFFLHLFSQFKKIKIRIL